MRSVQMQISGRLKKNKTYEGRSIEQLLKEKMEGESVELGAKPLLYTMRIDGVLPETDIRTDKWDMAMNALDITEGQRRARSVAPVIENQTGESKEGA